MAAKGRRRRTRAGNRARAASGKAGRAKATAGPGRLRRAARWLLRGLGAVAVLAVVLVALFSVVDPPTTYLMQAERARLGRIDWRPVALEEVPADVRRAVV
ncbi:MAG: hypothetical protein D6832_01020, partial [Alphaproteobacteria bacterium]